MNRASKILASLLVLAAVAGPAPADATADETGVAAAIPAAAAESPDEAIGNVLELIETETRVATASRMNADFVPGILTVLQGSDLEEHGLSTVWEALATVPGITISMSGSGERRVIVRGVGSTYAPATLKFMLNGVSLNNSLDGKASALLDIPAEMVERIEIIRGPGAVLYGEYASAGVINVITRQGANRVFTRTGSAHTWAGGTMLSLERPESAFGVSLNVAGWNSRDGGVTVESDRLTGSQMAAFSRAPGKTNEDRQNVTGIFALHYSDFALSAHFTESRYGDYFGFTDILPDPERGKVQSDGSLAIEAAQQLKFSPDAAASVKVGWLRSKRDWSAELFPAGLRLGQQVYVPDILFQDNRYYESRTYGETSLAVRVGRAHALRLGLGAAYTSVMDAEKSESGRELSWIGDDTHRRLANIFLQDEFEVTDRLSITGGLRYDAYDDVTAERITPRLSAVYRLQDRHIFKVQFAEAFRPPMFAETAGYGPKGENPDIRPEFTRTLEGGYIYKNPTSDARFTVFHSKVDGLIVSGEVAGENAADAASVRFYNSGNVTVYGGEVELTHRFGRSLTADANVSYLKTADDDTGREVEGAASWLNNLSLAWRPHRNVSLAAVNRYVGKRHRAATDTRDDLKGYDTVDLVLNLFDLPFDSVTVRAGVRNLFDADVRYPTVSAVWEDDLIRQGRLWWVQVAYSF